MIKLMNKDLVLECTNLALLLWPNQIYEELYPEFEDMVDHSNTCCYLYLHPDTLEALGFIQLTLRRDYVEGSHTSPVGYIEGIYVKEGYRRNSIALALLTQGEQWAESLGCSELGSDCVIENTLSIDFHQAMGFTEAERIVCFIKEIG